MKEKENLFLRNPIIVILLQQINSESKILRFQKTKQRVYEILHTPTITP